MSYEKVKFINFDDFYQNKKYLRTMYKELSLQDKILFKRFVYDEMKMYEIDKDCIWNFLNENEGCRKELTARYITIKNRYKKVHNLFGMLDESEKIKEINVKRIDMFNLM